MTLGDYRQLTLNDNLNVRVGDVVKLDGMLVNLESPDVGTRTTSLRRDDTGAGACEIIYVKYATIR